MAEKKRILIVDDEEDMRSWLSAFFQDNGYDTITACDGEEGMDRALDDKPDLITLDITMDKQSGVKMYRSLCDSEQAASIPVIIITGISSDFKRFIESRPGVKPPAAYFEKPVDKEALLKRLRELIG
jgi:DNA-binding response OmpR family regulator